MSETATIEAPATDETGMASPGDIFNQAAQETGHNINAVPGNQPPPDNAPDPKLKAKAKDETTTDKKPAPDDIPDEILHGTKVEPEKKDESTVDEDVLPPSASKKAHEQFAKVKTRAETAEKERDAFKQELETIRKSPPKDEATAGQLKKLQTANEELTKKLELADFRSSPRFEKLDRQEKDTLASAAENLKGTDVPADVIELAARATGATRRKILEDAGIEGTTLALVTPYLAAFDALQSEKKGLLDNHAKFREEDQQRERQAREQREAQIRQQEDAVFEKVGKEAASKFAPLQKLPGEKYADWNASVDARMAMAKEFFSGKMTTEDMAEIAYAGVSYAAAAKMNEKLREANAQLQAKVKQLTAGQPGAGRLPANGENGAISNDGTLSLDEQRSRDFQRAAHEAGHSPRGY